MHKRCSQCGFIMCICEFYAAFFDNLITSSLTIPTIIEQSVKNSHTQPAYDLTIKLYMKNVQLVKNVMMRTTEVLLLP